MGYWVLPAWFYRFLECGHGGGICVVLRSCTFQLQYRDIDFGDGIRSYSHPRGDCTMSTRYLGSLSGDRLTAFIACMKQKGRFCHHHITTETAPVNDKTLLWFQNRELLEVVGTRPKIYIVPARVAKEFKEANPNIRVQYIKSKVHTPRKHGKPSVRSTSWTDSALLPPHLLPSFLHSQFLFLQVRGRRFHYL